MSPPAFTQRPARSPGRDLPVMTSLVDRGLLGNDYAVHGNTLSLQRGCEAASPKRTCSVGAVCSLPFRSTYAVCGVNRTRFSISVRTFVTVSSSNKVPSCMIGATSPVHNALFSRYGMRSRLRRSYSPIPAIARIAIPAKIIPATGGTKLRLPGASLRSLTASFSRGCKGTSREYTT